MERNPSFSISASALFHQLGRIPARTITAGLVLLISSGVAIGAAIMGNSHLAAPTAGQASQAIQAVSESGPVPDTTALYLQSVEQQAIRDFWARTSQPDTTASYLRAQEEQAIRALSERAPQEDTTAYYLRAQEEQAIRDFWARAVAPDTTAYYLRAQEEQAIRTFRETHP
jgi:hypothetical protein